MRKGLATLLWLLAVCGTCRATLTPMMKNAQNDPWPSSMEELPEGELPEEPLEEELLEEDTPPEEEKPSVSNLEVVSEESCSINVSWKINGAVDNIKLRYQEEKGGQEVTVESPTSPHTIESLYPNTTYRISIQIAFNDFAELGGKSEVSITAALGPAPPTNLTAIPGRSNVSLDWEATDTPCRLSGYRVRYAGDILWSEDFCNGTMEQPGNATTSDLTSLEPYTNYSICVSAWTEDSQSKKFFSNDTCTNVQTKEDTPGPPCNVTATAINSTQLEFSWKEPTRLNGQLAGYVVYLGEEQFNTMDNSATFDGLEPCTRYTVTVRAKTGAGLGEEAVASEETLPVAPPAPGNLSYDSTSPREVLLSWSAPDTPCPISRYWIVYTGDVLWNEEVSQGEREVQGQVTSLRLTPLVPYTNYTVKVNASTGDVAGAEEHLRFTTEQAAPGAPTDLQHRVETETSMVITWKPPEEKNGILLGYTVTWLLQEKSSGPDHSFVTNETQATLNNLLVCLRYNVSVRTATVAGEGPACLGHWQTDPQEPPPHPSEVICKNKSSTSITTQWSAPANYTCTISAYKGFYSGEILWSNETAKGEINNQTGTSYVAKDLVPWSDYSICIKTIVGDKESTEESCCSARTNSASPSKPLDVQAYATGCWSIRVTWSPPEEINGGNLTYVVTLDSDDLFCVGNDTSCDIGGLESSAWYNVSVEAANADYKSEAVFVDVTTDQDVAVIVVAVLVPLVLIAVAGGLAFRYRSRFHRYLNRDGSQRDHLTPEGVGMEDLLYSRPMTKNQLREHINMLESAVENLNDEYEYLEGRSRKGRSASAQLPCNLTKNRFINIPPYDDTRVHLSREMGREGSDYINASFVSRGIGDELFIAAQGPKENTVGDFWRMIWEYHVYDIVMLTNLYDNGKEKCWQYWPEEGERPIVVNDITVRNHAIEDKGDFIVRILEIKKGENQRLVKQHHFTAWPDFGVPGKEHELLDFLFHIRNTWNSKASKHIVVHCSAGVGRTGTFIGLWKMIDSVKENGDNALNVFGTVLDMRKSRICMVQSKVQYLYLHKCIYQYINQRNRWDSEEKNEEPIYENAGFTSEENVSRSDQMTSEEPVYENVGF